MKEIYIVLTHTGTLLSRIIKTFTKDEFSHSSIALNVQLKEMYSFGRLHPYNPFFGGFVQEGIDTGTFKRFYNTKTKVYALHVSEEQYEKIQQKLQQIEREKENYTFNIVGLFAAGLHIKKKKEHAFYCAEFVKYILENAGITPPVTDAIKPEDFKKIEGLNLIYDGYLRDYPIPKGNITERIREKLLVYANKKQRYNMTL